MKPDWDKLADEFKDSSTGIYDVDCTAAGKDLCEAHGVNGYPTIKYGDPEDLRDYDGERDFATLKKFAEDNLGAVCGPAHLDLCDADTKTQIEGFMAMSRANLAQNIKSLDKDFSAKRRQYDKKRSKFDSKFSDFQSEQAEEEEQVQMHRKEKERFEKNMAKASKADVAKHEKKEVKAKQRANTFEKKLKKMEDEKAKFDQELQDIEDKIKKSGLKHMKAAMKLRGKEEL
eukprot:CAMPEP_0168458018 /NCGR_PEP_ID=MMETSP0228-20121227/52159_1 /TAXON_ID=133427 /ORGANISM="Protoceratium reticulatum, Strain CCCM 535 (=CCMP 1889)" /LENGTH=229 /DNA_ID=CAMNT_0008473101 /DNA_START=191 /DNA_END=880 /DNA_ORIENTATION=+